MLKFLSLILSVIFYIVTKSPPEQYSNSKIKLNELGEKIKPLNDCENAIVVFEDILGSSRSKYIDQFFITGRHNNLDICNLSQLYFGLPKKTIRNKGNRIILCNKIIKDIKKRL